MGLGLSCVSKLGPAFVSASAFDEIAASARRFASGRQLEPFFGSHQRDGVLFVDLHPAAESVEIALAEGGTLTCAAKTSGAGPGYHECVVELLDHLAKELPLDWNWSDPDSDDTGFARHRDFGRLQEEMARFLEDLAQIVIERLGDDKTDSLLLNMPTSFVVVAHGEVLTPVGPFDSAFFRDIVNKIISSADAAEAFYPWWEQGLTAQTWTNLGNVSLWMDTLWRVPANDGEREGIERTLDSFDRAQKLDPGLPIPVEDLAYLRALLTTDDDCTLVPAGIGYHRRLWRRELTGGWTIEIPGYFYEDLRDDGGTMVYWYGPREVWGSSWSIKPARPATFDDIEKNVRPDSFVLNKFGVVGCANLNSKTGDEGPYLTLNCTVQGTGSTAVITIVLPDEGAVSWARDAFMSVRLHQPPA